jgi:alpha-L-fucosidase
MRTQIIAPSNLRPTAAFPLFLFFALLSVNARLCRAADPSGQPASLSAPAAAVERWQDWRFGFFVHFDPSSLKGTEISWSRAGERRDRGETNDDGVAAAEYDKLYLQFNPLNFNAREWVATAREAGAKYIVFTAKHHDGFAMFDSKFTDYKITRSPFARDLTAELARACHEAGLGLGFYYSPPDWHDLDFFTTNHARYLERFQGEVRQLLTDYGRVDVLWFDTDGGTNLPETWGNAALWPVIRSLQPQILLTKRCGGWGDFDTPEQVVGGFNLTQPWETCMTICHQWAWKPDDEMKSLKECVRNLVTCAGGGGNFLFNVGPMPDGSIEPRQADRLREMGAWLSKNGDSVYGTRGGPWKPGKYGVSTRKGNTIYVHIFNFTDEAVKLPKIPAIIDRAHVLSGGEALARENETTLTITVPAESRDELDTVVALELESPAEAIPVVK